MLGTALPTPLDPLYDRASDLAPVLTSVIFATYSLGVVATLLFFGYLSDEIERRPEMAAALRLSTASAAMFLFANGLTSFGSPVATPATSFDRLRGYRPQSGDSRGTRPVQ
jgi:MFS family permease